jgi:hypothetical protein
MVAVFMRKQHGIQIRDIFADRRKPFGDLAAAEAGINQNARAIRRDERRITGTRGCENADLNDAFFSWRPLRREARLSYRL